MRVVDSRPFMLAGFMTTRRRRVCLNPQCGHRVFSVEVSEDLLQTIDLEDLFREMEGP